MADAKQILVVDDHFEMLEFLRSMLELSNQDYEVLAVPSAEEGLLELRRGIFDLLITDVRLPGMSGFDLVRRMKKLGHETPVIMITAYSSAQGKAEAEELGVFRYFPKPLDTDDVLSAVHMALHGESVVLSVPTTAVSAETSVSATVQKRLETLRTDTGAIQLMLATLEGSMVFTAGKTHRLDLAGLAEIIARNIQDSFLLADKLETSSPFTLQYHAGDKIELYCASVGVGYFLTLFFDADSRRGRIGTIWVFTQRAIRDIVPFLTGESGEVVAREMQETAVPASIPPSISKPPAQQPKAAPPPVVTPEPEPELEPLPALELDPLNVESSELADLLASTETESAEAIDLDAFWDDALTDDTSDVMARGMSLEEAREKGLIAPDLDEGE